MVVSFVLPLVCWGLVARTARVGQIVAILLAVCLAVEIVLARRWILPGERITLLVAFTLATIIMIVAGIVLEGRQASVPTLRSAGCRGVLGLIMAILYCGFGSVADSDSG